MRPFVDLSSPGQVRRLRGAARDALRRWDIDDARLTPFGHGENTVFRVDLPTAVGSDDGVFAPGRYAMRVHGPGYHTEAEIRSELEWLRALRRAGEQVPEPVMTSAGRLTTTVSAPDALGPRVCTMLRWMGGRLTHGTPAPGRYTKLGAIIARLHNHAESWERPEGFTRLRWDWEGLFGETVTWAGATAAECFGDLPSADRRLWRRAAERFAVVAADLGEAPDRFGLIHGDPHMGNTLYAGGDVRLLDFDDAGFGYHLYDVAVGLGSRQRLGTDWPIFCAALCDGYRQHRPLPIGMDEYLDHFFAARAVSVSLWIVGMVRINPGFAAYVPETLEYMRELLRALDL